MSRMPAAIVIFCCFVLVSILLTSNRLRLSLFNWQQGLLSVSPIAEVSMADNISCCSLSSDQAAILKIFGLPARMYNASSAAASRELYVTLKAPAPIGQLVSGQCLECLRQRPAKQEAISDQCFRMTYSWQDMQMIYKAAHNIVQEFETRNLTIMIADGSLLGSVRHFGIIPWDDDLDVMILEQEKPQARRLLTQMAQRPQFLFRDTEKTNQHWHFGFLCSFNNAGVKECKVVMDFFFLKFGRLKSSRPEGWHVFPTDRIFPLQPRPFGQFLLPMPKDVSVWLRTEYGTAAAHTCKFYIHSHRFSCPKQLSTMHCSQLRHKFPFVSNLEFWSNRSKTPVSVEVLTFNNSLLALFVSDWSKLWS